ncbi:MAG: hypothetical protein KDE15_07340 [Erythrobacter sp.]|nr:hypothetical protein [Erythrobacter sp.]
MSSKRNGLAGKAAFGALLAIALPSAGLAFGVLGQAPEPAAREAFVAFTPADADPRVARFVAQNGGDVQMMRFTPAGVDASGEARSITVAVRVDDVTANALGGRSAISTQNGDGVNPLRVTPTRYNLGLARGYGSFAQSPAAPAPAAPTLSRSLSRADIPDLAEFVPTPGVRQEPSRFAARVELEEGRHATNGEATGQRLADQMLDVGGSYSLTRNLDITAGVRYEQDRDLSPDPSLDTQDSQAVYIGTQFRF